MKSLLIATTIVFFITGSAHASCLEFYNYATKESMVSDAFDGKMAPAATTSVLPLPISTIMDAIGQARAEKMRNLIVDANNRIGLTLAQNVSETGLTKDNAISLILALDEHDIFCTDRHKLLTFDDAVKLGKIK